MGVYPDIIDTEIIDSSRDIFWNDAPQLQALPQRNVLILSAPYAAGSAEEDQLTSILKAGCKLQEDQYNILKLEVGEQLAWFRLRDQLSPKVILLFNVLPAQLGISALFQINELNNFDGRYWLPTLSLTQVQQDKTLKGQIWNNGLKLLFETKKYGPIV